ncbi:MAG: hypothetical protein GF350_02440 [Chitinivibrionales bacterium]|nr:hypothetical protein [Chitinivibrionales bacterium]
MYSLQGRHLNEFIDFKLFIKPSKKGVTRKSCFERFENFGNFQRDVKLFLYKYKYTSFEDAKKHIKFTDDFSKVFEDSLNARIWMFTENRQAVIAQQWAIQRGIAISKLLSIISLENNPAFYHMCITSCIPDWDKIGYVMAHAVIGDIPIKKTSKGFIRANVKTIERLTTR